MKASSPRYSEFLQAKERLALSRKTRGYLAAIGVKGPTKEANNALKAVYGDPLPLIPVQELIKACKLYAQIKGKPH